MIDQKRVNKFVIANPVVCIGCATCMAACYESAYKRGKLAVPRLVVTRSASGTMPNQCRQCDDAPCANVCPVGALRFEDDHISLTEEICIGCKMCTIACPFGAIRAEAQVMPSVDYSMEVKPNLGLESAIGLKSIAVKCDLCKGDENGTASIGVFPTGALVFVNETNLKDNHIKNKAVDSVEEFIKNTMKFA